MATSRSRARRHWAGLMSLGCVGFVVLMLGASPFLDRWAERIVEENDGYGGVPTLPGSLQFATLLLVPVALLAAIVFLVIDLLRAARRRRDGRLGAGR